MCSDCKHRRCHKKDSSQRKIRVVTKNMTFGVDLGSRLTSSQGYTPTLPSFFDLFDLQLAGIPIPEVELARMFENYWQQANSESLFGSRSRLTAMAKELATADADVICLQEAVAITNNPLINNDGSVRSLPYEVNNGFYGKEDSPEFSRTFNFVDMLIQRLRDNHGLEYHVLKERTLDTWQGKRTLNTLADAGGILNMTIFDAVIAKKKVKVELARTQEFFQSPKSKPFTIALESDPENPVPIFGVTFGIRRGFISLDLKVCGKKFRLINTHLESGSNGPFDSLYVVPGDIQIDHAPAGRAQQALQLLREEVIPSPYPVILAGDLNCEFIDEVSSQEPYQVQALLTLAGSVDVAGNPTVDGGVMIDTGRAIHGNAITGPEFKTSSIAGSGRKWDRLRNPASFYRIRIDHILYRRDDHITPTEFGLTQPVPYPGGPPGTGPSQWAWTSDHNGVYADFKL